MKVEVVVGLFTSLLLASSAAEFPVLNPGFEVLNESRSTRDTFSGFTGTPSAPWTRVDSRAGFMHLTSTSFPTVDTDDLQASWLSFVDIDFGANPFLTIGPGTYTFTIEFKDDVAFDQSVVGDMFIAAQHGTSTYRFSGPELTSFTYGGGSKQQCIQMTFDKDCAFLGDRLALGFRTWGPVQFWRFHLNCQQVPEPSILSLGLMAFGLMAASRRKF
jgi:hypothetical protein